RISFTDSRWHITKVFTYQSSDFNTIRFFFVVLNSVVPDVGIGSHQNLSEVRRISKDLLIPRRPGVKTNLSKGTSFFSGHRFPVKNGTIGQQNHSFFSCLILHELTYKSFTK